MLDDAPDASDLRPLVVTHNYPTIWRPHEGAFVEALVRTWFERGLQTSVIAPVACFSGKTRRLILQVADSPADSVDAGGPPVLRGVYPSFSIWKLGPLSGVDLTQQFFTRTVLRAAGRAHFAPTLVYAHFLSPSGVAGATLARQLGVPAVVAIGESSDLLADYSIWMGRDRVASALKRFAGILAVSEGNKAQLVGDLGVDEDRIRVVPNAVDPERFHPREREAIRRKFGLPVDRPILVFLGSFDERKGVARTVSALERHPRAAGIFLGDGPLTPSGSQVLLADRVGHAAVPEWLSAADFLVLPTRFEGSPNAIIEAMACGLPVISSDIRAVEETVSSDAAILVGADDIDAISGAIGTLIDDQALRLRMGAAALAHARRRTLAERADGIADWLRDVQREFHSTRRNR